MTDATKSLPPAVGVHLPTNAVVLFLVKATPLGASFAFIATAARSLTTADFALLCLAAAILPVTRALSQLGLDPLLQRQVAANRTAWAPHVGRAKWLLIRAAPAAVLLTTMVTYAASGASGRGALLILLVQSSMLFRAVTFLFSSVTLGLENPQPLLLIENVVALARFAIGALAALTGYGLLGFVVAYPISEVVGALMARRRLPKEVASTRGRIDSTPTFAHMSLYNVFSTALVNADAVILNRVSTSLSLATYRIADRVSRLFDFTGYSIAVALFPSATRAHLEDRSSVKGPLRFAIRGCAMQSTLLVVLAALVWVAGQPALQLVFGDQYADAASITALLLLSYIPVTWAQPLTFLSLAKNRLPSVTAAYGVTLAIAVVANLFAARLGAAGCAMVALGTRSLVCLLLLVGFLRTS